MKQPRVLAVILAGGKGSRLEALTRTRVKPALRMAGTYRLIDVSLSNLMNSNISDVWIIEQYLPHTLNDHLSQGRPWDLDRNYGGLQLLAPFEGATGEGFAGGNSDSLWRQRERIASFDADLVLVLSADHLYTADLTEAIDTHISADADLTMITTRTDGDVSSHGVVESDDDGRVTNFWYKPDNPTTNLVATEIFCFTADKLGAALDHLYEEHGELGDYGDDLIPYFVENLTTVEHRFDGYWVDLGTVGAYWQAHMQLLDGTGATLDDPDWPIYSAQPQLVPGRVRTSGTVDDSFICPGSDIGGTVSHSVIGPKVTIEEGASVTDCVILDDVYVGPGVHLKRCVVDMSAQLTEPRSIGNDDGITLIDGEGTVNDEVE